MTKWQCKVCGYIHEGTEPPELCPVCGADQSRFIALETPEGEDAPPPVDTLETPGEKAQKWQCAVCGTTREGDQAPAKCPVCGAEQSLFSAVQASPKVTSTTPADDTEAIASEDSRWQCTICRYIHTGPEPPDICPVCGADRSKFVRLEEPSDATATEPDETEPVAPAAETAEAPLPLDRYRRWIDLAIEYHAHPIAVHIPNGVLPVAVGMVLLAVLFDWPMIGQAGVYNMGFVLLSMPVVLFTGYLHWQYKFGGNMTDLFKWKIICGAIVSVLAFILFFWGLFSPESARNPGAFYLLLHIIMLIVAGVAGWLGGKLVFRPPNEG